MTDADLERLDEMCDDEMVAFPAMGKMTLRALVAEARAARRYREALTTIQELAEDELRRFVPKGNVPQIQANARAALAGDQPCPST